MAILLKGRTKSDLIHLLEDSASNPNVIYWDISVSYLSKSSSFLFTFHNPDFITKLVIFMPWIRSILRVMKFLMI